MPGSVAGPATAGVAGTVEAGTEDEVVEDEGAEEEVEEREEGKAASVVGAGATAGVSEFGTDEEGADEDGVEALELVGVGVTLTVVTTVVGSGSTTVYAGLCPCRSSAVMVMVTVVGTPEILNTVVAMVCVAGGAVTVAVAVSVASTVLSTVAWEACSEDAAAPDPPSTGTTEYDLRLTSCLSWFWPASGSGATEEARRASGRMVRTIMAVETGRCEWVAEACRRMCRERESERDMKSELRHCV